MPQSGGDWIISEMMSPLDYSQQVIARKTFPAATNDAPSSLLIGCRGVRTEFSVGTSGTWRPTNFGDFKVAYRIEGQPEIQDRWASAGGGRSAVFRGDAVKLINLLPDAGSIWVRVHDFDGTAHEATFQLTGLDPVRRRIAAACKTQ
jgi:hypothetical protein